MTARTTYCISNDLVFQLFRKHFHLQPAFLKRRSHCYWTAAPSV